MRAKTKKNFIVILNAVISVVFAFIIGSTYAFKSETLIYGTKQNSASTYLANQQIEVVNDTILNPIPFGVAANNHEISVQYSVGYDFDVRLSYSLSWSDEDLSTDNVILHFADRDKFIVDEQYIYYANHTAGAPSGIPAGSGKLSVIVGVDFVDTEDFAYNGQNLTIDVQAEIYKVQEAYNADHPLAVNGSKASTAWLIYKNPTLIANPNVAYAMVYNYRHDYEHGVPYAGPRTAYSRQYSNGALQTYKWLGGNKSYAGTGIYLITGSSNVTLSVKVSGLWRTNGASNVAVPITPIQYNYAESWVDGDYDDQFVFETRTFDYYIKAKSVAYIDLLNSIEINSMAKDTNSLTFEYDISRIVTDKIMVNGTMFNFDYGVVKDNESLTDDDKANTIGETNGLLCGYIKNAEVSKAKAYTREEITVVNPSRYNNTLFVNGAAESSFTKFETNLLFINNTADTKQIAIANNLKSYVGNGSLVVLDSNTNTRATSFGSNAYYQDDRQHISSDGRYATSMKTTTLTIAPYSAISGVVSTTVAGNFREWLQSTYCNDNNSLRYDAWLELDPAITIQNVSLKNNLVVESEVSKGTDYSVVGLKIKNNSNKVVTGVKIDVNLLANYFSTSSVNSTPIDWETDYWNYVDAYGNRAEFGVAYNSGQWKLLSHKLEDLDIVANNVDAQNFDVSVSNNAVTLTNNDLVINPNEVLEIGTITVDSTEQIIVNASVVATTENAPSGVLLVNSGKSNAYLINYGDACYVRFSGTLTGTYSNILNQDGWNYYLGIVRPGQIIDLDMTSTGTVEFVKLTTQGWTNNIKEIVTMF